MKKIVKTAKKQWEEDSKDVDCVLINDDSIYKIENTKENLIFYVCYPKKDRYVKAYYPSLSEIRKDGNFITRYIQEVHRTHPEDLQLALEWLAGGDYKMIEFSMLDIIASYEKPVETIVYKDEDV